MPDDDIILRVPRWQRADLTKALQWAVRHQTPSNSGSPVLDDNKHGAGLIRTLLDQLDA